MGNYSPAANPATNYPSPGVPASTAASPVTGGDPLQFTGTGGQVQRATDGNRYAGIAAHDAATGQSLVRYIGVALFTGTCEGPVTAGDQLTVSAVPGRQVKTAPPGADASTVVGEAQDSAGDGGTLHWRQR